MAVVSIISLAASISAMTFAGPRVYYAMARDGVFFPAAARVHPRYQDADGGHRRAVDLERFAGAVRRRERAHPLYRLRRGALRGRRRGRALRAAVARAVSARPFRALGYPVAPAIFVLASLAIVVNAVYRDPGPTGAGLAVIAAGVPLYIWFTRRQQRRLKGPWPPTTRHCNAPTWPADEPAADPPWTGSPSTVECWASSWPWVRRPARTRQARPGACSRTAPRRPGPETALRLPHN